MTDMLERAARALMERKIPAYKDDSVWAEDRASILMRLARDQDGFAEARAALLAALDPEDEALVGAVAQRLADDATAARNAMRLIRHGIDLSNANPVSPAIFTKDVRAMLETLKAMAQGEKTP